VCLAGEPDARGVPAQRTRGAAQRTRGHKSVKPIQHMSSVIE